MPKEIQREFLESLQQRLVKTGGRLVKHARYYWLLYSSTSRSICSRNCEIRLILIARFHYRFAVEPQQFTPAFRHSRGQDFVDDAGNVLSLAMLCLVR